MNEKPNATFTLDQLRANGFCVRKMTPPQRLARMIRELCPQKSKFDLIRIGRAEDGGYLVPNDLEGILACFSPGVDTIASFEADLQERFRIGSHLADYSVERPPSGFGPASFTKKFIGASDNKIEMTLDTWIERTPALEKDGDLLLQMDIEGAEYSSLLSLSPQNLKRFRILIIEFHNIENWGDPAFFRIVASTFKKLLTYFMVVHNHPNNCCGLVNLGGVLAPRVFELTLIRRDRSGSLGQCETFPHELDRPNLLERPDLVLPGNWFQFEHSF